MNSDIRTSTLGQAAALDVLANEWLELERAAQLQHPFLSSEWLGAWWAGFGTPGNLRMIVARRAERLIAALPLELGRGAVSEKLSFLPARRLGLLQNGYSDRSGFLCLPGEQDVVDALVRELFDTAGTWDFIDLRYVPLLELERFERACATIGLETERMEDHTCYFLDLSGTWDGFLSSRSAHFRKRLKENRLRLDKAGVHEVVHCGPGGLALDEALRTFLDIDARSWRSETESTIASDPGARAFYSELLKHCAARGGLDLRFLKIDGKPVAAVLGVIYGRTLFGLKTAYDAQYHQVSPGAHLLRTMIEDGFGRGLERFDFIRGDDQLRRRWTESHDPLGRMMVYSPRAKGRVLSFLRTKTVPLVKRLLDRQAPDGSQAAETRGAT